MPNYYEILGVPRDAEEDAIKKAYFKKARDVHPDKTQGDPAKAEIFKELSHAYEVLSDPERKQIYDQYGEEGLKQGGMGGFGNAEDIFSQFFGGGGGGGFGFGGGRSSGPRKGNDISFALGVTLKDLYNGAKKKLRVNQDVVCKGCDGKGSKKEGALKKCPGCRGQGVKFVRRQMGPSVIQMQQDCDECNRKGEIISPEDRCKQCKGKKVVQESKIVEVEIDRGMQEGQRITFSGEGDQAPGVSPGDIIVVLKEKDDPEFQFHRRGDDLILQKEISLLEALTGYEFVVKHLDGRNLLVKSAEGDVTEENDIRVVNEEGMPQHRNPFIKGHLFIKFTIAWPKPSTITKDQAALLVKALPAGEQAEDVPMDAEEVHLTPYDEATHEQTRGNSRSAYQEDEPQGQSCVQQ